MTIPTNILRFERTKFEVVEVFPDYTEQDIRVLKEMIGATAAIIKELRYPTFTKPLLLNVNLHDVTKQIKLILSEMKDLRKPATPTGSSVQQIALDHIYRTKGKAKASHYLPSVTMRSTVSNGYYDHLISRPPSMLLQRLGAIHCRYDGDPRDLLQPFAITITEVGDTIRTFIELREPPKTKKGYVRVGFDEKSIITLNDKRFPISQDLIDLFLDIEELESLKVEGEMDSKILREMKVKSRKLILKSGEAISRFVTDSFDHIEIGQLPFDSDALHYCYDNTFTVNSQRLQKRIYSSLEYYSLAHKITAVFKI